MYSCAVLTKHVSGVLVEMKFDDDTAIGNGWIFSNFGFWKAQLCPTQKDLSFRVLQKMKFDDDTGFWKAQLSVQHKKTSVLEYYRKWSLMMTLLFEKPSCLSNTKRPQF